MVKIKRVKPIKSWKSWKLEKEELRRLLRAKRRWRGVRVMEHRNTLNRVVNTKSFFKTHKHYSTLNEQERKDYIDVLSREFISSARDLMESLKDK